jgi:hypothetical protein
VERFGFTEVVMGVSFAIVGRMFVAAANRFAGQRFRAHGNSNRRGRSVRLGMSMAVIVIFKIFENVADVQEGVAIQTDVNESGLHARQNSCDAALVDAADKRELFFALDVNFD